MSMRVIHSSRPSTRPARFERRNIFAARPGFVQAHGGEGFIQLARLAAAESACASCSAIDFATLPVGSSIGEHTLAEGQNAFYLILSGTGRLRGNDEEFDVTAGDLVSHPAGGRLSLVNTGAAPLKLVLFTSRAAGEYNVMAKCA